MTHNTELNMCDSPLCRVLSMLGASSGGLASMDWNKAMDNRIGLIHVLVMNQKLYDDYRFAIYRPWGFSGK